MLAVQSKCSNLLLPCEGALPRENGRIARAKRAGITFGSRAIRPASGGMSTLGHFQTKSEALSARVYWSGPPTRADVLALCTQGRRVRLAHLSTPRPPISLSSGHRLEHVADLEAPRRGRRPARHHPPPRHWNAPKLCINLLPTRNREGNAD